MSTRRPVRKEQSGTIVQSALTFVQANPKASGGGARGRCCLCRPGARREALLALFEAMEKSGQIVSIPKMAEFIRQASGLHVGFSMAQKHLAGHDEPRWTAIRDADR